MLSLYLFTDGTGRYLCEHEEGHFFLANIEKEGNDIRSVTHSPTLERATAWLNWAINVRPPVPQEEKDIMRKLVVTRLEER
jgi:hypothetical protein